MRVSIFGLGYVGAVSAACLARDGHEVIGVDVDDHKLALLRSGRAPILEEGIQELTRSAVDSGRLNVTSDAAHAISNSELSFVCVGTPSRSNGSQDLTAMLNVTAQIGAALRDVTHYHCVVIRSTVEPGTVNGQIRDLLEENSGKSADRDFGLCFQPEFLREGTSIRDYDNPPFTVVGTESSRASDALRRLFGHLPGEFIVTDIGSAEILKYACNCFHAVKITFANEIGRISKAFGVDSRKVMDLVCRDTHLNISKAYLKPGFAFGGSCLPKDLRALMYMATSHDVSAPMLGSVMASNREHLERAMAVITDSGARKVGMIGLSFKKGTDDLRESPLVSMAEYFIGKGISLQIYDPHVNLSMLMGANKKFIERHIPHLAALLTSDCADLVTGSDAIVVGAAFPDAVEALGRLRHEKQLVLDLTGNLNPTLAKGTYQAICW